MKLPYNSEQPNETELYRTVSSKLAQLILISLQNFTEIKSVSRKLNFAISVSRKFIELKNCDNQSKTTLTPVPTLIRNSATVTPTYSYPELRTSDPIWHISVSGTAPLVPDVDVVTPGLLSLRAGGT